MLPSDQRSPPSPSELIDSPVRHSMRREMVSDADITRPHNPPPRLESSSSPPQWHVQLELHPEQLVTLHRMGFTNGALAWREGMDHWQPLRVGSGADVEEPERSEDAEEELADADEDAPGDMDEGDSSETYEGGESPSSRRRFVFPRSPVAASVPPPPPVYPRSTLRPPPPEPRDAHVLDELLARPLPPPPRLPTMAPPVRPQPDVVYEPAPPPEPPHDSGYPPAPLALVPRPGWLARSDAPVALERAISLHPTVLDEPRAVVSLKTLWFGLGLTVVLSAGIGALVSALVISVQSRSAPPIVASLPSEPRAATTSHAPASKEPTEPAKEASEPRPASVSVDQLPLLSGTSKAAPVTITEPARAEDDAPARVETPPVARGAAPAARHAVRERAPARRGSSLDEKLAAQSTADAANDASNDDAAPEPAPAPAPVEPGPPDRGAIARAVTQAAAAARSCGTSPEHGTVLVKFSPSGNAQSVQLVKPFSNRDVNGCVLRAMSRARVAPFVGEPVVVRKTVRW